MRGLALVAVICIAPRPALAQADAVVDIGSRGQKIRALVLQPSNPTGSVVLLAGGHGKLDLDPAGKIGWVQAISWYAREPPMRAPAT